MIFFHGTDLDSALNILSHGLDEAKLNQLQKNRPTQIGSGWYTTTDPEVGWFFASLAPGNQGNGFTVIELELAEETFEHLHSLGKVIVNEIHNVPFVAKQVWFDCATFPTLNQEGVFRPSRSKD